MADDDVKTLVAKRRAAQKRAKAAERREQAAEARSAEVNTLVAKRRAAQKRAKAATRRKEAKDAAAEARSQEVSSLVTKRRQAQKRAKAAERRKPAPAVPEPKPTPSIAGERRRVPKAAVTSRKKAVAAAKESSHVVAAVEHRKTVNRILDRQILHPMRDVYKDESDKLARGLRKAMQGKLKTSAGARQAYTSISGAVEARMQKAAERLATEMVHAQRGTLSESANALGDFIAKSHGKGSVLDDDVVKSRIMTAQRSALEASQRDSVVRLTAGINQALQKRLSEEISKGATVGQAINALSEELDAQWWRVERLVRTETSRSFNEGQRAGIMELAKEDPQILMRWTEHVSDLTGEPMDNRVGKDSIVLHGQVAKPGRVFTMPTNDERVPKGMSGQTYMAPPNRCNDRAVLLPWKPGSGIPAWKWQGGRRVRVS